MKSSPPTIDIPQANPLWKIGIVRSHYYKEEIDALITGARDVLLMAGIPPENILEYEAFGSFEIPLIGKALAESRRVDALIGIGIILQGETHHAELLASAVTQGIMDIQVQCGLPFAMEVLHVNAMEQARARASADDNRGREAALSVLASLSELEKIRKQP